MSFVENNIIQCSNLTSKPTIKSANTVACVLDYIKRHRKGTYTTLLMDGKLNSHLHEIDVQAHLMLDEIIANLSRKRGIDEKLKAHDMLKWVAEMNNIKASAEEIVLREVVLV